MAQEVHIFKDKELHLRRTQTRKDMHKLKEENNQNKDQLEHESSEDTKDVKTRQKKGTKDAVRAKDKKKDQKENSRSPKKGKDKDKKNPKKKAKKKKNVSSRSSSRSDSSDSSSASNDTNSKKKKSESSQNSFTRFSNFYFGPPKKEEIPAPQITPDGQFYLYAVPISATSAQYIHQGGKNNSSTKNIDPGLKRPIPYGYPSQGMNMGVYDSGYRDTYDLDRGVYRSAQEVLYNPRLISTKTMEANLKSGKAKKNRRKSSSSSNSEEEDSSDSEDERVKRKAKVEKKERKERGDKKKTKKKEDKKDKKKIKKAEYEPRVHPRQIPMVDPYGMYFYQPPPPMYAQQYPAPTQHIPQSMRSMNTYSTMNRGSQGMHNSQNFAKPFIQSSKPLKLPVQSEKIVTIKNSSQSEKKSSRMDMNQPMYPPNPYGSYGRSHYPVIQPGQHPFYSGVQQSVPSQYMGSTRRMAPVRLNSSIIESDEGEEEDGELLERAEL